MTWVSQSFLRYDYKTTVMKGKKEKDKLHFTKNETHTFPDSGKD